LVLRSTVATRTAVLPTGQFRNAAVPAAAFF
jgi:hypothetical protein